jgi:L-amino acid N-acyltransferase YncA
VTAALTLRAARPTDAAFVWQCRQDLAGSVGLPGGQDSGGYAAHQAWMTAALADPHRLFLIPERADDRLGYVRIERDAAQQAWRASLCITGAAQGRGTGRQTLQAACDLARTSGFTPIFADIHTENAASLAVFARCGFTPAGAAPGLPGYVRHWLFKDVETTKDA